MKVILPASGFGKRNPDESAKELMSFDGHPLIEFSFSHLLETSAKNLVKEILIITRKEKVNSFRTWLKEFRARCDFRTEVEFVIHEPEAGLEWPMTVLASERLWDGRNLVLLPDTKITFQTLGARRGDLFAGMQGLVAAVDEKLASHRTVWGLYRDDSLDVRSYGVVDPAGLTVTEKPLSAEASSWIWGCFAFQRVYGRELLLNLEKSTHTHVPFRLPQPSATLELAGFADLSRAENLLGSRDDART